MRETYTALELDIRCGNGPSLRQAVETGGLNLAVVMLLEDADPQPEAARIVRREISGLYPGA